MTAFVHPRLDDVPLATALHALADPARLAIVARLARDGADGGDGLACSQGACAGMPRATMSNHYAVLRGAGIIESRKVGARVCNRLRRADIEARFPGLLDAVLRSGPEV